jgi:hypothetical protein
VIDRDGFKITSSVVVNYPSAVLFEKVDSGVRYGKQYRYISNARRSNKIDVRLENET